MGYYVYFVMNGGLPLYSPVYDVTEIPDLDHYIPYKSPTSEYSYEFVGWYYDAELTTQALTGDPITANTALYALWIGTQRGGYSITFVANGGTPIPADLTNQTAIPDPLPSISKTGLTFDAWRWGNSSTAVAVVPGEPIYADATIYAKWVDNLYDITYNSNGGSAVSPTTDVTAFPSPLPTSTKAGYTFAGWWNYNLTLQYSAGQPLTGSLTVYAKWLLNSFSVTYVANGGSPEPDDLTDVASLPSPLPEITKTGYELDGWYFNSLFAGSKATPGQLITQNETLYAKFVRVLYVIDYELDGGTNNAGNPDEYNVESPTITLLDPSKVGYVFGGWFSDAEMTTAITSIPTGTTGDITIYALFTLSETGYSITWVENGGTPEQTDLTNQNYLPSVLPALYKANYVFKGWYKDEVYTIAAIPSALIGENTTLYAKFEVQATPKKGYIRVEPIDTELSETSKKPLQNKAIYKELNLKVDKVTGKSLVLDTEIAHLVALDTQAELDIKFGAKEDIANKGVANGYAPLNASGIVDPIYVPSAYTDYVEYATYADLPATGDKGTLYVVIADETSGDNTSTYRWTGSVYVNVTDKLSASEVKALYESNANTNAYTDDEKSKLSGIEPNAEVNILEGIKVEGESDLAITDKKLTIPLATDTISGALDKVDKAYIDNVRDGTQSLPYDNTTSGLDSTTLNGAIDEVEARVENVETEVKDNTEKNSEQDLRIATIEEAYRKSQSGELTATKSGTDIISLGKDVAPAPLQIKVDGGFIPALENEIINGQLVNSDNWTLNTGFIFENGYVKANVSNAIGLSQTGIVFPTANVILVVAKMRADGTGSFSYILRLSSANVSNTFSPTITSTWNIYKGALLTTSATDELRIARTPGNNFVYLDDIQLFNLTASHGVTATSGTAYDNAVADIETILALKGGYISSTPTHAVDMNKRVRSVGKNLFDKSQYATDYAYKIQVKPSTQYTWSASTAYKTYDVDMNEVAGGTATTVTTGSGTYYIAFSGVANVDTFQLELGSTATTYVPYANTDLFLQPNKLGYKLPNGVADTEEYRNGKYYFVKRVQELTITSGMISSLNTTTHTTVDWVIVSKQSDDILIGSSVTSLTTSNQKKVEGFVSGSSFTDDISNIGTQINYSVANFALCVAKGTYADLAAARSDLAGTKIWYQLATPITTEILALGNAQGLSGGTVYIDDVMADSNIYTSKYDIENTAYPIKSLDRIVKINADGSQTELVVSSATIAGDGLSFTHPSLVANDIVWVAYVPNVANTFKSNTFVTYYDSPFIAVQPDGTPRRITFSVDNSGVVTVSSEAV